MMGKTSGTPPVPADVDKGEKLQAFDNNFTVERSEEGSDTWVVQCKHCERSYAVVSKYKDLPGARGFSRGALNSLLQHAQTHGARAEVSEVRRLT